MHDKERKLYEERIALFIKRLKPLFYQDASSLTADVCLYEPMVEFSQKHLGEYHKIEVGDEWGGDFQRAWFHIRGSVPKSWKGRHVVARINLGGEGLVFDEDGVPVQGLSVHTVWGYHFESQRERFPISEKAKGGEVVDLWIEATAGQLFGLKLEEDKGTYIPEKYGNYRAKLETLELAIFRKDIWELFLDCTVLDDLMRALPEKSVRRKRILHALSRAINGFNESPGAVEKARGALKTELARKTSESDFDALAVGHAHIDTAWLWPVDETRRKCARTFANQIGNMEKHPDFVFGASQAQHYAFVKDLYPGLYAKIRDRIEEGRWEVQGGMWVEADCNIIGGEAMVRQVLHGKNFFLDEFGLDIRHLWLPDVFGYSAAMPQILKKSGMDFLVTQKISWNQFNRFPHHTFVWRGIDHSEIIAHFPPEDNYNSSLYPSGMIKARENFDESHLLDEFLVLYGIGDGGGGPSDEIIGYGQRQRDLEGCPRLHPGRAQDFLDRLEQKADVLPQWIGELYLELHRGTLTTHGYNKKMNRLMELRLREVEILYSALPLEHYPAQALDRIWKLTLMNQFHDIIPGSSITPVYDVSRKEYDQMEKETANLRSKAGGLLFEKGTGILTLVNTLSFDYSRPISIPDSWTGFEITDDSGNKLPVQSDRILMDIPAMGTMTLHKGGKTAITNENPDESLILENKWIRYEFDDNGQLMSAEDKETGRRYLSGPGNRLSLYEDRPANWDAWDVDIYYENERLEDAKLTGWKRSANGPLVQELDFTFTVGHSGISQKVTLAANSRRLDFRTQIDWDENHKMLRTAFHTNVKSDTASFEIQYGHVKRPAHRNTSWDMAKFETVAHRWVDLSTPIWGCALLNDCKYGHKVLDGVIDLNLLRAPTMPDPGADRGHHVLTYSFLPHTGGLMHSDVIAQAAQLNQPALLFEGRKAEDFRLPFSLDTDQVILETVKKAEKEDALIVRLYEPYGKESSAGLQINRSVVHARECDLMENDIRPVDIVDGKVDLIFGAFEIKTLKFTL